MRQYIKEEFLEFRLLLKSVPSLLVTLFVLSIFSMNLLANKSLDLNSPYISLDCGIIVSWFAFLTMDIITSYFGPKASTQLSVLGILINLAFCLFLFIGSFIPGVWSESFITGSEDIINNALNKTFGGTWYVLLGSTIAFLASSIVNNFTNYAIGLLFKKNKDNAIAYISKVYISTAIGQFVDNFIFALIVSHIFFGWSMIQCLTCSLTGMLVELLCEIIFSFFGYKILKKWENENIGLEYFKFKKERSIKKHDSTNNGDQ